jgi:hypothetical protein
MNRRSALPRYGYAFGVWVPGDNAKMYRFFLIPEGKLRKVAGGRFPIRFLILLTLLGLLLPSGCLFHKKTPAAAPALPPAVRIVLLPVNAPAGRPELRPAALAATVQMAECIVAAPDLEPMPFWESTPAVLQILGASRTITDEIAEFTAGRLTARWGAMGDLIAVKSAFTLRVDFIPSKASLVPFRYEQQSPLDSLQPQFQEAFAQFLRYLIVRPLATDRIQPLDAGRLKEVAQALDTEYGWFVTAKPGAAGKVVENLARTHRDVARILFNPTLYPVLAK